MSDGRLEFGRPTETPVMEDVTMLPLTRPRQFSDLDQVVFETLVSPHHYLRRAAELVDFGRLAESTREHYHATLGRPGEDAALLIKLEFLQFHDGLSDREVIKRAQTDVAYRWFLGLALKDPLPDPSTLCYFRGRLGEDGHRNLFQALVTQAREHGLVKDRLRLKDATHVVAAVAIPATLSLVAQVRNRLLAATEPFDPTRVTGERARAEVVRSTTESQADDQRLAARIEHLRDILAWADELPRPADAAEGRWQQFVTQRTIAHKVLSDREQPQAGDQTRSAHDPDVRRGKHGAFYDGYSLDVLMDPDSELITNVNVLPANGHEAADAAELVRGEEAAQHNDVQAVSIDGIGFDGPVLRDLQDPAGLELTVYVPPKPVPESSLFGPDDFTVDAEQDVATCPAGATSRRGVPAKHARVYRFPLDGCRGCALLSRCMERQSPRQGRSVQKNDYEAEYVAARQQATTPEYAAVRKEHPKIERKLSELVNQHGARKARYRGQPKVLAQGIWTCLVVNVKRMVRLVCAPAAAPATT